MYTKWTYSICSWFDTQIVMQTLYWKKKLKIRNKYQKVSVHPYSDAYILKINQYMNKYKLLIVASVWVYLFTCIYVCSRHQGWLINSLTLLTPIFITVYLRDLHRYTFRNSLFVSASVGFFRSQLHVNGPFFCVHTVLSILFYISL